MRKGVFKSNVTLSSGNEEFKIFWFNEATGTDMKKQRVTVRRICDHFIDASKQENIGGSVQVLIHIGVYTEVKKIQFLSD